LISDKKSEQKPLEVPNDIYQTIINDILDTIVEIDLNGNFTYVSPQCYQMFGYNPHEVIGRKALRFVHPNDLLHVMNKMKTAIEDQKHISYESRAKHKNGGYVHVSAKGGTIKREGITKLIAVVRDITEKKIAEVKLKDSEYQYRTIIESMGDPIHVVDTDLRIILTNNTFKNWVKRFNISQHVVGKKISEAFPFLPEKVIEEYHKVFETGNTLVTEELTQLNEKEIYTETRKIPIYTEGKVIQVVTIVKDITDRKIAEIKLKESEKDFRNIIENTKDAIVIIDYEGKLLYISPQLSKMLKGREISKNIRFFHYIHKNDVKKLISFYTTTLKEQTFLEKPVEFRILPKHGDYMWFSSSSKNYYDDEGNVIGFISTLKDITDKKIAEQKLLKSLKKRKELEDIVNKSPAVVFLWQNAEGWPVEFVSENVRQFGYEPKEFLSGKLLFSDIIHPDDLERITQEVSRYSENEGKQFTQEYRVFTKSREIRWIDDRTWVRQNSEGIITHFQGIILDITERKKAEELLKESEQKYRLITEQSNDLIRVINEKFELEYVNELTLLKLLGYSKEELIGKNSIILNHPEDYKKIRRFMLTVFKKGENMHETRIKHKNGSWVWFENKAKAFIDEKGNQKYLFISRDITERKKSEKALKESEQKYRLITENSNDLIRVLNEDFKIEYLNERTHQQVFGYTYDDLIGDLNIKLNHPEDYAKSRRFMLSLFKSKEGIHVSRMRHKNGNYLWFEVKAKMFKDDQGNQKYLFISRNITERRKTELALMESEEKYRNLYKNSPNAVILSDRHGLILDMNSSAERILGYSRSEMIAKNYIDFNIVTSNQVSIIKGMYLDLYKSKKPKPTEFQIKKKNGNMAWIFYQSSMIKLGNEIIIESIAQDITDKKKAENLIIEENKRLLELNKMKTELISRVSHELKTPITSIFGGTQILLELYKEQTGSEALQFIEIINRGGKRLKILIENLLDASRIESEKLKLNLQKENIVEIVKSCINENRYLAIKQNIILELNLPEVVNIEIDKIRIEQVITKLLSNAFKNTPKKGIIRINLEEKGNAVYFKINDTGIGLTKEEMEKLFTKFGKIEHYGQKMDVDIEGSGLGLYISKEIVDLHGGHIWGESAGRNEGSTFYIKLFKKVNDLPA